MTVRKKGNPGHVCWPVNYGGVLKCGGCRKTLRTFKRVLRVDFTNVEVWYDFKQRMRQYRLAKRVPRRLQVRSDRYGGRYRRYIDYDMEHWREIDELTAAEHHYGWGRD